MREIWVSGVQIPPGPLSCHAKNQKIPKPIPINKNIVPKFELFGVKRIANKNKTAKAPRVSFLSIILEM